MEPEEWSRASAAAMRDAAERLNSGTEPREARKDEPMEPNELDLTRLADALAIVFCDLESTPGPSGSHVLGEGTSYWRDRAEAVADHYAAGRTFADLPSDE